MTLLYAIVSVLLVSLVSFVGLFTVSLNTARLKRVMLPLISFAAGTLLGDALIHILPELVHEHGWGIDVSLYLIGTVLFFFALEHFIRWHHYHHVGENERHPMGMLNLVGDGFHNLIDGLIIGSAYLVDLHVGIATTIAVLFHELPQEIGDFAILLHSGFTKAKALWFNFLSALLAVAGTLIALWIGSSSSGAHPALLALIAGGFLYIATADLIPELHKEVDMKKSLIQLFSLIAGIGVMLAFTFFE